MISRCRKSPGKRVVGGASVCFYLAARSYVLRLIALKLTFGSLFALLLGYNARSAMKSSLPPSCDAPPPVAEEKSGYSARTATKSSLPPIREICGCSARTATKSSLSPTCDEDSDEIFLVADVETCGFNARTATKSSLPPIREPVDVAREQRRKVLYRLLGLGKFFL